MLIDFDELREVSISNCRGGEKEVLNRCFEDRNNKICYNVLVPGASIGFEKHDKCCEIIYIIKGKAKIFINEDTEFISEGEIHYCPKGSKNSIVNNSDADVTFLVISLQN